MTKMVFRLIIIGFIILGVCARFIVTRDPIYFWLLVLVVTVYTMYFLALRSPRAGWVRFMYGFRGVRTDVKYMTRAELLHSGRQFLLWALGLFICEFVLGRSLGLKTLKEPVITIVAISVAILCIPFLACFFGGLYLLLRGLFRRKDYIPPKYLENYPEQ